ncbi:Arsenical resistance operon repressor / Arsenate reductase [Actinomycetales bacterium JB111]|nr:Arsenical resistance operon repressor / Arsenate reductase [Actinomycetales bacterium JB111]
MHAALADTARLRIVDLLRTGDRSPGELGADLGLTSNLLAHHLGVLDRAGLIRRTRSEGDGRRSYLHLRADALAGLTDATTLVARRVLFVCTGNSARSQLAAALWARNSAVPAVSAGTHPAASVAPGALTTAERHRLPLRHHTPRDIAEVIRGDDLIVTVCDRAHEEIGSPAALHWSVPNPGRVGTDHAYDAAFEDLAARVAALGPRVTAA